MSMPFYVSPEQMMKDRADFARKGIARGRSVVALQYADGVLFVSENPSQALHKVSEIYDRIAFAAVGRYNEFENLRIAGVRLADMRGYAYDRRDVTGRGLANAYAQTLGTIFSSGGEKPYEVEIFVAEIGDAAEDDQLYRLTYDGQVADEHGYAVMGGAADVVAPAPRRALRRRLVPRRRDPRRGGGARAQRGRRPGHPDRRPRGRRPRPHPLAAAQVPAPARGASRRGPRRRGGEHAGAPAADDALAGAAPHHSGQDDPTRPDRPGLGRHAAAGGPGHRGAAGRPARRTARRTAVGRRVSARGSRRSAAPDRAGSGLRVVSAG